MTGMRPSGTTARLSTTESPTSAGDVPVGVNRDRSTSLEGDPSHYSIVENPRPLQSWEPASASSITGYIDRH